MRILLDECVPRPLAVELVGYSVRDVTQAGWAGVKNGALLSLVAKEFDIFITMDRRLSRDHPIPEKLAIITIRAFNNA